MQWEGPIAACHGTSQVDPLVSSSVYNDRSLLTLSGRGQVGQFGGQGRGWSGGMEGGRVSGRRVGEVSGILHNILLMSRKQLLSAGGQTFSLFRGSNAPPGAPWIEKDSRMGEVIVNRSDLVGRLSHCTHLHPHRK